MQKQIKPLVTEFFWLLGSFILAFIITVIAFQIFLGNTGIDIHLYDTYFILPARAITIPLFVFITFLTFFIKEVQHKFRRILPTVIIIIFGLALIIMLSIFTKQLVKFGVQFAGGWTAYPPLSALPQQEHNVTLRSNPFFDSLASSCIIFQITITVCLLVVSYFFGRRKLSSSSKY